MTKPIIALDIDDVLSHSAQELIAYGNAHWGHTNTIDDFNERLAEMWQVDHDEVERRMAEIVADGLHRHYQPAEKSAEVLRHLQQRFRIIAVTSRRNALQEVTDYWVQTNYPGIVESIIHTNFYGSGDPDAHKRTKADKLKQIGARYLIDDQPKHCNGAAAVGVHAVLFGDYPWSRSAELAEGVVRCKDWQAVQEYFDGIKA